MAPRSLIVRMPMRIPFALIAAPYRPLPPFCRPLPPGSMRHERQLHHLRRHPLAPDVDLERGARLRQLPRQVGHADGGVGAGRDGAAAHDVPLAAVEIHPVAVAGHGNLPAPAAPAAPGPPAPPTLAAQARLPRAIPAPLE